jgi:photosystem II stability/assembly factor-like uncharacterized protein
VIHLKSRFSKSFQNIKAMKIKQKLFAYLIISILMVSFSVIASTNADTVKFDSWQIVGPSGGDIRAIAIDPKDKNRIYATTLDSQVYVSADAGKSWTYLVTFDRPQITLDNVIVDVSDSNAIYVSGHRHKEPGGFWRSKDQGKTWKETGDLKKESMHAFTQSEKDPKMMMVGTFGKVFVSRNSGEDWKSVEDNSFFANLIVDSVAIDPRNTNTMFAGTSWRAYKTTDAGKSWKRISAGMIDDSDVFAIEIDKKNPDHIIASCCSGIYESFNSGELWKKINGIPSASRRTRAILQNPSGNGAIYAGTTEGFWMSPDAGKSWLLTTQRDLEINSIAVHPDEPNKVYIATNNYGLMVSTDGGRNFDVQNGNLTSRFTYNIIPDVSKANRFYATTNNTATGGGFVFISDDSGQTWKSSVKNLATSQTFPSTILQDEQNQNIIYLGTNQGMFKSLDRGASWSQIAMGKPVVTPKKPIAKKVKTVAKKPVPAPKPATPSIKRVLGIDTKTRVNSLSYANDGKNGIFAATNGGLYRSQNIAAGWDKFFFGAGIDEKVFAVAASALMPNRIFAGTTFSGVLISEDNGLTWKQLTGIQTTAPISAIEIDPNNADVIYIGTTANLYVSRDGGVTWSRRGGNLPNGNFRSIAINPNNSNEVFVASSMEESGGIYQSVDAGKNWKRIDGKDLNLPTRRVWSLAIDPKNTNRLLVGTHSSGIYTIERTPPALATGDVTEVRPRVVTPK